MLSAEVELANKRRQMHDILSLVEEGDAGSPRDWPRPMGEEAFIGVAGDFVRLVEPHTEADRVALLGSFLVAAGYLFGREAWVVADGKEHYPIEFLLTVGETGAGGRKGTAWERTKAVMKRVDPDFSKNTLGGLSSAEGLIKALSPKEDEKEVIPPRIRCRLAELPEFASLLAVMKREGNTLSPALRQAWDGDRLRVLTRKDPLDADGVNLSVVAQITPTELLNSLTATDRANGFANRFLIMLVRRSKSLPEGGMDVNCSPIVVRLHGAVQVAQNRGLVKRDDVARQFWAEEYERLTRTREGLRGALCGRAEAHALRLSLIYALLDGSSEIRPEHVTAAVTFWDYCERSIDHIFSDASGDPKGAKILRALSSGPMTATDLARLFQNNESQGWIAMKMAELCRSGKIVQTTKEGDRKKSLQAWALRAEPVRMMIRHNPS